MRAEIDRLPLEDKKLLYVAFRTLDDLVTQIDQDDYSIEPIFDEVWGRVIRRANDEGEELRTC